MAGRASSKMIVNGRGVACVLAAGANCIISKPLPGGAIFCGHLMLRKPERAGILRGNNALLLSPHPNSLSNLRFYTANDERPPSPTPTPPNLPSKDQVAKAFFRCVAFIWDFGYWMFAWSRKMVKTHVVENQDVQYYWKRFHEKMEDSKKN